MLRRAAATLSSRPAAWLRHLPRPPWTAPPAPFVRQTQDELGGAAPPPHLTAGLSVAARGYARMARRLPPTRPDGYSTSDGEADELDAEPREEVPEVIGEEGDDAEDSELEGFMVDFGSGSDGDEEEEADAEGDGDGATQ